jgi:putative ABC transport system permease protein
MTAFLQAWRALARRPGFTFTAVLTLAAGIAITATMFSIVDGVLLRPLPFPDGDRLVAVYEASPGRRERTSLVAPVRLQDWDRLASTFAAISGSYSENMTDTSGAEPERLDGRRVMPRFFDVFQMTPIAGRTFVADEERFGGSHAAIISDALWLRRFARSPSAIGARLILAGAPYTIVGVMPRAFTATPVDLWVPAQLAPGLMAVREARFLGGVGRIKPGVSLADVEHDLARVQTRLGEQYPNSDKGWSVDVRSLKEVRVGDYRRGLLLLFAAVGVLFAIAVANVSGLVLVQMQRRAAEFAVRAAIGASRLQIAEAVLREMIIVAALGAALGALASRWLIGIATAAFPGIPRIGETAMDRAALAFVIVAAAAAALVFGVAPALVATRARIASVLAASGRSVAGGRHRLQAALVVAQLALGVVLAGTAGLLVRSYAALADADAGFDARHVLVFHVGAAWDEDRTRVGQMQVRILAELQRLPGVRQAGFTNFLPVSGATLRSQIRIDGMASTEAGGLFTVGTRMVTAGYLKALAVPLVAGEWCADPRADFDFFAGGVRRALVNQRFVERFGGGRAVIGQQFTFNQLGAAAWLIAGVVRDTLEDSYASPPVPYVYTCVPAGAWPDPEYVVRTEGDPRLLAASIRQLVKSIDPARPVFGMKPLADIAAADLDQPRLNAAAVSSFAAAALLLAALGLYGLLTLFVAQRRRELGVRLALGASRTNLAEVVLAGAGKLVLGGLALGVALTLAAGQILRSALFGVAPYDPWSLAAGVAALGLAALAAIALPARQALRTSAMEALRQ